MNDLPVAWRVLCVALLSAPLCRAQAQPASEQPAPASGAAPTNDPAQSQAAAAAAIRELPRADTSGLREISRTLAVRSALEKSPDLRAAELGVKSAKQGVLQEQGRYPYYLSADAGYTHTTSTSLRADDSVSSTDADSVDAGVGVRRQFAQGTLAEVRAGGQYFWADRQPAAAGITPFASSGYGATFRASVSQPLLRGYGTRVGEAELRAARVSQKVSEKSLDRVKSSLVGDVLSAYFELWYASRALDIETSSLALAREQYEEAKARLELGGISRVDLLTFQTRASELEESLIAAELTREQRSVTLSQLMGQSPPALDLFAANEPDLPARHFEQEAVAAAMRADSVELAELEEQVRLAKTRAEVSGESWRPRLDAEAWAESAGISTDLGNAWARAARGSYWSAHAGLVLDLPLDDSARQAEQMQAELAVQTAKEQLSAARQRVGSNATAAIASERAARERLTSAERTTAIAEETYFAERERYDLGQSVAIAVQVAEAALRQARLREARARVDAAQARLVLLHLTGALLSSA